MEMVSTSSLIAALGSFLGGSVLMAFVKPNSVPEALIRSFVTAVIGLVFTPIALEKTGMMPDKAEHIIAVAFCVGFLGWSLLGAMANFLRKQQDKDIFEVIDEVKRRAPVAKKVSRTRTKK
jgi:hypothetical protein